MSLFEPILSRSQSSTGGRKRVSITDDHDAIAILLVDDDADCRMLIRDAVSECGVANRIFEVANGREALSFLRHEGKYAGMPRPGLIYMDVEMPHLNGLETLQAIRGDATLRDIPVVMMTGVAGEEQMKQAAELGANSYTLKPANAEQFLQTVLASTSYWLKVHQYPNHHLPADRCKR